MSVENIVVDIEINNSLAPDIEQSIVATIDNNINVIKDDTDDLDVTINRKEYVITGDEIYIPKRYEDAPTWLQNMIDQVVKYSIGAKVSDMNQVVYSLNQMIEAMEVSKNTYEMSVISSNDINTRINTAITTLNSNMNEADATILSIAHTKTTPKEAEAIMINAVRAELESTEAGTIGAAVATLSTAIANESEARSTSVETLYSTMEGEFEATATAFNTINTYVGLDEVGEKSGTGLLADVEILQKQNDGVIETTTGTYDVMINPENPNLAQLVTTSEPYATWRALDTTGISNRLAHIGDVYVKYSDTANGAKEYIASYKFIRTAVDETSPYATDSDGFTWALVIDQAAQDAYEQALNAYDLADSKRRVFTSTPSGVIDEGDLWVTGTNPQVVKVYKSGQWELSDTQVGTFVDAVYQPMITSLQNQIDGKIENWFTISTNDPKVSWVDADTKLKHNGDLWYQTDTKISYYYTSSTHTWNILDDAKAIQALSDAATAQTAANNAQTSANNAQTSANTANSLLADIASDSKFTPSEKSLVKKEWDSIQSEYTKNLAQGTSYSVSTAAYTTAYNALNTYITPLLASLTTTSDIVGTTFRATFKAYYDANVDLLNAISNKINLIADGKITSYYMATFSAVQAMSTSWTASEKTSNIGDLAVVYNDTTVDNNGTWRWDGANWVTTRDKKLVALASQVTALSTDLQSGDGTWADADSTLTNSLTTTINDKTAAVESKFAYNSVVGINGVYKKSGFGLTTNYVSGSGTQSDPYVSEFWIDASRMKFTNSNQTGSKAPFTIDATGTTPEITFNGKVSFTNVTNTSGTGSNLLYNSAPKIGSETKGWYVWTNSGMTVNLSAGWNEWKPTGGASVAASIGGNPSIGSVFDVGQSSRFPVIAGSRYEASAYISAHRSNSFVLLVFYDIAGNYVVESGGNVINYSGSSALVNWGRSSVFATAPSNAATATLIIRSNVTGSNPYCFVANAFAGVAEANQTTPSNWSEGTSAGATYTSELSNDAGYLLPAGVANAINTNTTTINGSKITTGSIGAAQIAANSIGASQIDVGNLFAQNITYTGVITGGNVAGGGIIKSYNGNMVIDLKNGSIYIS